MRKTIARRAKEEKFWNWVTKNKIELEERMKSNQKDSRIYKELTKELKKYNSILVYQITLTENDEVVFIITPDGIPEGVLPTEELYDSRPSLNNWIIKKFIQPKDEIQLNYDGIEYPSSDIEIIPELDENGWEVNIKVFIRNMNSDPKRHEILSILYLEHILGEYIIISKIGIMNCYHLEKDQSVENGISILELRKFIEKEFRDNQ